MRFLSGTDTQMLYADTPHAQNLIAPISIFDPSTAPGGQVGYEDVLEYVRDRLHLSETFRERLVRTPLALDRPMWIRDPDFDLEYHVREIALPRPGDWNQFITQIARLGSRPLDMSRPPWELYVIYGLDAVEGVPTGSFATMLKLHHAAVDGVAGAELITALMQSEPGELVQPPTEEWKPEPVPSYARRLAYAGFQTVARPVASYRSFLRAAAAAPTTVKQALLPPQGVERMGPAPATRFNAGVSSHRVWNAVRWNLTDIKAIKNKEPGATVNDAAVTLIGGAMRRYLDAKGELPESTVSCIMPISVRPTTTQKPDAERVSPGGGGNQFAMTVIPLGTNIAAPWERLRTVRSSTAAAKKFGVGALTLMQASEALPGALIGTAQRAVARLMTRAGRTFGAHTIVTNVPGPRSPMYFCDARAVFISGMAPIVDGMGSIFGVGSYVDEFFICWTADRDQMPDPGFFADCLREEFGRMQKAPEAARG
jgi:diacylglycerol O-acyltransferase / wax synthase